MKTKNQIPNSEPSDNPDRWTITRAAKLLIVDVKTVAKGLRDQGLETSRGATFTVAQCVAAVYGDAEKERVRILRADATRKEREEKEADGQLYNLAVIERTIWEMGLLPTKQALGSVAAVLAAQCNPDNPTLAREVLQNWAESLNRSIREPIAKELERKENEP